MCVFSALCAFIDGSFPNSLVFLESRGLELLKWWLLTNYTTVVTAASSHVRKEGWRNFGLKKKGQKYKSHGFFTPMS